jgi:hypothetical protein
MILLYHSWVYIQRNVCQCTIETPADMSIESLFIIPSNRISIGDYQLMNGWRKCGICAQCNIIQP